MSTKRIKSITPMQAGKVMGALYGGMALIFVPFLLLFALIPSFLPKAANAPSAGAMIGVGIGMAILLPIFYAVTGFVMGLLGAVIYNLIAGWVGGIEFEVE
jgi:hypothetical protein